MNLQLHIAILQSVRTQTRLSCVTGISEWRLSRIVNGWQRATPEEQLAISSAVGVDPELLFTESRQMAGAA